MSIHSVRRSQTHLSWSKSVPPVLTIASGDVVSFDCLDASNGQITASSGVADILVAKLAVMDQVNGPIYVQGAKVGDVLKVELMELTPAEWGWSALFPGFGLLADEFEGTALKLWSIQDGVATTTMRLRGSDVAVSVPVKPFMGEVGLARGAEGHWSTIPPYRTGGNMDTKHLTKGSTVYLPIEVDGALFAIGDGHAAQGDGEVCGTAIETPMRVTVRLTVLPASNTPPSMLAPHYESTNSVPVGEAYYTTMGIATDLREAARDAVRGMFGYLVSQHGFEREDAYILCSVAADLRLHEVVDMPNYLVGMMMPKSVLPVP
ncbi:Acetamidase/Formamidase [Exidia glandulosa HHB12029]|uniref:Acetamidase/Formamidase n=1 Tax=Exidia glandulosa HHB12029 TaxID=1314781 RepID=A0A165HUW7_EXIGL|nr:Acetamidase/Formamidase [Exidia glandulosa HHB12029]